MHPFRKFASLFPTSWRFVLVLFWTLVALGATFLLSATDNSLLASGAAISIVVLGLTWLTGWSGQISIGNSGFMAVGGYAAAIWFIHHTKLGTVSLSLAMLVIMLIVATIAGAVSGLVLGLPSTRLRGPYLAGVTLAFAYTIPLIAPNFPNWTGSGGLFLAPLSTPQWYTNLFSGNYASLSASAHWLADVAIVVAAVAFFFMANLFKSRTGRAMRLVRDNDVAAELVGVNLPRTRTLAFVIAAAYGGLGGGLLAVVNELMSANSFTVTLSIVILTIMVIGGIGTLSGAVIAGVIYAFDGITITKFNSLLGISSTSNLGIYMQGILFGALLILTMLLAPRGIAGIGPFFRRLLNRLLDRPRNSKSDQLVGVPSGEGSPSSNVSAE
jgi:branched-chain amino acid transport system permease protein